MIAWKRGLSLKFRLATTNSKWSIQEKIKHLLKCLSGYVELAKLLQKPENKMHPVTTRARHSRQDQDVLVITLLLKVIVINIIIRIISIVRVFFIAVSNVITKLIPTINLAAKITAFTYCLPRLRLISLAQPGLTSRELCCCRL